MIKKLLAGVLAFSLAFTVAAPRGTVVYAAEEQDVSYYEQMEPCKDVNRDDVMYITYGSYKYYVKDDGTAKIVDYTGDEDNIVIPSVIMSASGNFVVTEIGPDAFLTNYSAETLTIPYSVTNINESGLRGFESLEAVYVEDGNTSYKVVDNVLFDMAGKTLILYPQNDAREIYCIPEGVTYISTAAFENAFIRYVTMPDTVTGMGDYVFSSCDYMRGIVLSNHLKNLGDHTFWSCDSLEEISLPNSLETIGLMAFAFTSITRIEIPDSVTSLGQDVFTWSALQEVKLSSSLKTIPRGCFSISMGLEKVIIPEGVEEIEYSAFAYCDIKSITLPKSLKKIGSTAFDSNDELTDIYYAGDAEMWNKIDISKSGNNPVFEAAKHYNVSVDGFVERLYSIALNRNADEAGLNNWATAIKTGSVNAANAVEVFVGGEEFKLRNLSNADYVDVLYRTFFNREADEEGKNFWVSTLEVGYTREFVLSQFVNLDEFKMLCDAYGIERGIMFENGVAATPGVVQFVNGLYEDILGRNSDVQGLYTWAYGLTTGTESAYSSAHKFFNSQEYILRDTDNMKYVLTLYRVFMNRGADATGFQVWSAALNEGAGRNDVLAAFAGSAEFAAIAASYGIK